MSFNNVNNEKVLKLQMVQNRDANSKNNTIIEENKFENDLSEILDQKNNQSEIMGHKNNQNGQIAFNNQVYSECVILKQSDNLADSFQGDSFDQDDNENEELDEELQDQINIFYQENSYQQAGCQQEEEEEEEEQQEDKCSDRKKSLVSQKKFITKDQGRIIFNELKQYIKQNFYSKNRQNKKAIYQNAFSSPQKKLCFTQRLNDFNKLATLYILGLNKSQDQNTEDAKSVDQDSGQYDESQNKISQALTQNLGRGSNNSQEQENILENRRRSLLHENDEDVLNQGFGIFNKKSNKISKFIFQKNITISQSINKLGYFAMFLLFFFTLFVFFALLVQQQTIQDIIPYLSLGPNMLYQLSQIIMNKEYESISQYMSLNNEYLYDQSILKTRVDTQINDFRQLLGQAEMIQSKNLPSQSIVNLKISFYNEQTQLTPSQGNIISTFEQLFLLIWQYSNNINGSEPLKIIHLNSQLILDDIVNVTNYFYDWTLSQLDETKIYLQVGTFSILGVSFLIIFVILPIYCRLQLLKEKIIQQFATFSCDLMNKRNIQIDEILYILRKNLVRNDGNSEKKLRNEWKNVGQMQIKKKSISRTNNLKLWNLGLFILSVICLALLSIYPLVNYFMTENFLHEYKLFINELSILQNTRSSMIYSNAMSFLCLSEQMNGLNYISFEKQKSIKQVIMQQYETSLHSLYNFQNDFQSNSRYQENIQRQILIEPLVSNTCQALEVKAFSLLKNITKNFQFFLKIQNIKDLSIYSSSIFEINFDQNSCKSIQSGILYQGSIISYKNMMLFTQDIWNFLEINQNSSKQNLISNFKNLDNNLNFSEFMKLGDFIDLSFNISTVYTQQVIKLFFSYLDTLQTCLLLYSIILLIAFILFGWRVFLKYIQNEIVTLKSFYSLLSNDLVVNNNYIYSFIKSYLKK